MVTAIVVIIIVLIVLGAITTGRSLRVVQQYEQGIVFRFGRVLSGPRGPGLTIIRPFGDRMQKVNMQIVAMAVPAQEGITRDNVSVRVDAVVYFRVVDPIKATINVQNYMFAVSQQAQTSLRSIIGQSEMDQLLAERDIVNRELRRIIDEPTEGPWGVRVERVEIKDVSLPEGMKRSMSRQAEAERERRARIITADGEYQASKRLAAAANVMARDPAALQLRLLQTVVEVAAERNSTLVMPIPVELLRFFDKMAPGQVSHGDYGEVADTGDAEVAAAEAAIENREDAEPEQISPVSDLEIPPVEAPSVSIPEIAAGPDAADGADATADGGAVADGGAADGAGASAGAGAADAVAGADGAGIADGAAEDGAAVTGVRAGRARRPAAKVPAVKAPARRTRQPRGGRAEQAERGESPEAG